MAIDPKTLTIGSHINVRGKRVEIESITNDSQIGYYLPNYDDWRASDPAEDYIEPITITEELLTELGFSLSEGIWRKRLNLEQWIFLCGDDSLGDYNVRIHSAPMNETSCVCKYLHELESFLYLTTKTELIKE